MKKNLFFPVIFSFLILAAVSNQSQADNIVDNWNFESTSSGTSGIDGWNTSASPSGYTAATITAIQHDASSGHVVIMPQSTSSAGYAYSRITQSVSIPRDALGTTLTVWRCWFNQYQTIGYVYLRGTLGSTPLFDVPEGGVAATPEPGWVQESKYLSKATLSQYYGQNVNLQIEALDHDLDITFFYVDEIVLDLITATMTSTPTITLTPTITKTVTITPTPTITRTITPTFTISPTISPTPSITPWPVPQGDAIVYPNPASGDQVTFMYSLSAPADIDIDIFNLLGYKVAHLEDKNKIADINRKTTWNIRDIAPGVYLYQVTVKSDQGTSKNKMRRLVITK